MFYRKDRWVKASAKWLAKRFGKVMPDSRDIFAAELYWKESTKVRMLLALTAALASYIV
jgi:hypothetical protein